MSNLYILPVFKAYPETTFGGVFETEADYKDPVVQQLIADQGWAVWHANSVFLPDPEFRI